jgi:hypothetical protein
MISFAKQDYFRSKAWLRAVASLPCVQCGQEGTQAAHRNQGKGMALKVDDSLTAALCPACHTEIDQGNVLTQAERRQRLDAAILKTLVQLTRAGLVGTK